MNSLHKLYNINNRKYGSYRICFVLNWPYTELIVSYDSYKNDDIILYYIITETYQYQYVTQYLINAVGEFVFSETELLKIWIVYPGWS